ncbi:MAG: hypothetical protein WAM60_06585 [Candidatus Promineifilaceae bacterium]
MIDLSDKEREMIVPSEMSPEQAAVISTPGSRPLAGLISAVKVRPIIQALVLFTLFAGLLAVVQYGTDALVGTDGYYHARMGMLIRQEGLRPNFKWLPLTILNANDFYDHHLLYHVYLALFAGTDPLVDSGQALTQSMKLASIVMPALAFLAIWWLLRAQRVKWAALWAFGLFAVSEAFLYRMSMPRAQSASLLVLVLGLHWLLTGKYRPLIPLGFIYVWLYDGFPLLPVIGGLYLIANVLIERRFVWQAVAFPVAGILLGLLVNPYFPANIHFTLNHLLPKVSFAETPVGNEWYPYDTWTLVENSGFALGAFVLSVLGLGWQKERINLSTLTLLFVTVFFGLLLFKSRRFVEYFPAFTLIFTALSVSPSLQDWLADRPRWHKAGFLILPAVLALPIAVTIYTARDAAAGSKSADWYADAAGWLAANGPEGSFVFQTDWDDFPRLFFYNPKMIYTVGLDPTYMELHNSELYHEWVDITQGNVDKTGEVIRDRFGAQFVFTDLNHEAFLRHAADDPLLKEIYRDNEAVIFAVEAGEAPGSEG